MILSSGMLLDWLGPAARGPAAGRRRRAAGGRRPRGRRAAGSAPATSAAQASTDEFTDAVVQRITAA